LNAGPIRPIGAVGKINVDIMVVAISIVWIPIAGIYAVVDGSRSAAIARATATG